MKTFIAFVIGCIAGLGITRGVDFLNDPPPPSPQAQVIIDSMNAVDGWRLGKRDNCIVNEKANTVIDVGWPITLAGVKPWEEDQKDSKVTTRDFGLLDRWHIGQHYHATRLKLEVQKFQCTPNTTPKTVTK